MKKSESIVELAKALSAFQGEVKQPAKDKSNPFFKSTYVDLAGVVSAISETAKKHGLSFIQYPINDANGRVGIVTMLMHQSGEYIETEPIYAMPGKQDPQAIGSTITYLKRYSLAAVFGITSEVDDDGNNGAFTEPPAPVHSSQQTYRSNIPMPANAHEAGQITITFGKHKGKTLKQIWKEDMSYINYLLDNEQTDPAIREGIGMMQVAAAQQQASKKMQGA